METVVSDSLIVGSQLEAKHYIFTERKNYYDTVNIQPAFIKSVYVAFSDPGP